jgi:hypothetical protein
MSRRVRTGLIALGVVVLLLVAGGAWLLLALRHVPRFYEEAGKVEPVKRQKGSDELLRRSATLHNDVIKPGQWQALFTADQINGWLAVDLVQNHPKLLPPELHDPRVAIEPHRLRIGCLYDGEVSTVASIEAEVTLQEPNVIAVRIRRARAGAVPLPLDKFMPRVVRAVQSAGFPVELRQIEADPVLIIRVTPPADSRSHLTPVLESLELRDNEIYVAGESK